MKTPEELMKKRINDHLYWHYKIDASKIKIFVEDRKVILSGITNSFLSKKLAEKITRQIEGVRIIENNIKVKYPKELLILDIDDSKIQSNARTILELNASINKESIKVEVKNGIIILEGIIEIYWKKKIAEDFVSEINGVIDVLNNINVIPKEKIPDKKIEQEIISAIKGYGRININEIELKVEEGNIAISGRVMNFSDNDLIIDTITYIAGVRNIENNLSIN